MSVNKGICLDIVRTQEGMTDLFRLEKECPARSIFQTEIWMDTWWNIYKEGKVPFAGKLTRSGDTVALFPLYMRKRGSGPWARRELRLVGTGEKVETDFHDFLACKDLDDGELTSLFIYFLEQTKASWDGIVLSDFDEASRIHGALVRHGNIFPYRTILEKGEECPYQDLPETKDRYVKEYLSSTFRRRLKNKTNKLQRETNFSFSIHDGRSDLGEVMRRFAEIHQTWWTGRGEKGAFHDPQKADFLNTIAVRLGAEGELFLSLLTIDGQLASGRLGFLHDGVVYDYQASHNPKFLKSSPGLVCVCKTIEAAIDRGVRRFEALRGTEPYKKHFTRTSRWTYKLRIFNNTSRGTLNFLIARSGAEYITRKLASVVDEIGRILRKKGTSPVASSEQTSETDE